VGRLPGSSRVPLLVSLVLLALAVAACEANEPAPTPSPAPTATSTSTPDRSVAPSLPTPIGLLRATVTRVIDGDTIEVQVRAGTFRVRYIGIDTPETVDPRRPVGCYGKEASARNRMLVEDQTVGLEKDISDTDGFGRLLRYVWVGDRMVNAILVQEGYASAATFPPDVKHAALFASLEHSARLVGLGLWGTACEASTPTPSGAAGACEHSPTGEALIKGNISRNTSERIYHVPGGNSYDATVIDEARGERWFCTEAQAAAAGWRKSSG